MRIITYKCDICKEEKKFDEVYTIYWNSGQIPQQYILKSTFVSDNYDKQICKGCVAMIKEAKIE